MPDASPPTFPRFLPAGTSGLVVEFGLTVDEALNEKVLALDAAIEAAAIDGIWEVVPTYRSLIVHFDPLTIARAKLTAMIEDLLDAPGQAPAPGRLWSVPVRYGGPQGEDLEAVAERHGLTADEVVARHTASPFRVYMIGFAPGFAYLGGLDPVLHTSRRTEPRMKTPARTISIGGTQSAINPPFELPSGWHLLGQTPVRSYDPAREDQPFLFRAGDRVRFRSIELDEYEEMCERAEAGDPVAEIIDEKQAS